MLEYVEELFESCAYDVCAMGDNDTSDPICTMADTLVSQCLLAGFKVNSWRTNDFCRE